MTARAIGNASAVFLELLLVGVGVASALGEPRSYYVLVWCAAYAWFSATWSNVERKFRARRKRKRSKWSAAALPALAYWKTQGQRFATVNIGDAVYIFLITQLPAGPFQAVALSTPQPDPSKDIDASAAFANHAHLIVGDDFEDEEAAYVACCDVVIQLQAGLALDRCGCGEIPLAVDIEAAQTQKDGPAGGPPSGTS